MDAIITYVDCDDNFINQYHKYCDEILFKNRYRSYGVLDLQIKGIRKFMPYINNIFVIVSDKSQLNDIELDNVIIIEHKDIIPEDILPVFNSCAIEMFMWNIPNLGEQFIYFNDDMFILDYIDSLIFFNDNKPCLSPYIMKFDKSIGKIHYHRCYQSTLAIKKLLNIEDNEEALIQVHIPKPYLKSTCEFVFYKLHNQILNRIGKLKNERMFNCYLFNNYDYLSNNYSNLDIKYKYFKIIDGFDKIIKDVEENNYSIICINDNHLNVNFEKFKIDIRNYLLNKYE